MFCEGCRGSVSKQLIKRFKLDAGKSPQTYGLGFKELWQLPPGRVQPGLIQHTVGWPLDSRTYGGSFLYHLDNDRVYVGFVVGLDYEDPRFKPFEAFQQYKNHPADQERCCKGGEIIAGGARTVIEGGYQSMPTLEMPGAMLVGDAGGTLNTPKIKGIHQAIRSGMTAAAHYRRDRHERRFRQALARIDGRPRTATRCAIFGRDSAAACGSASPTPRLETVTFGKLPWTLANHADDTALKRLDEYVSPDRDWGERELPPRDRLAFVFFAATTHDENQPVHLHVADTTLCATRCIDGVRQSLHQFLSRERLRNDRGRQRRARSCRSMPRTASIARPATSRNRTRIRSPG